MPGLLSTFTHHLVAWHGDRWGHAIKPGSWRHHTFAGETFDVEMFGLDPKYFTLAWLPTFMAVNDRFLRRVVRVLRVGHWKKTRDPCE